MAGHKDHTFSRIQIVFYTNGTENTAGIIFLMSGMTMEHFHFILGLNDSQLLYFYFRQKHIDHLAPGHILLMTSDWKDMKNTNTSFPGGRPTP